MQFIDDYFRLMGVENVGFKRLWFILHIPYTWWAINEFYAEFNGIFDFHSGQYRLVTSSTGAVRVFVDGILVFDDWRPRTSSIANSHLGKLEITFFVRAGFSSSVASGFKVLLLLREYSFRLSLYLYV